MKASLRSKIGVARWLTLALGSSAALTVAIGSPGCSTTATVQPAEPPLEVALPDYAYLPHPRGYTTNDVRMLFTEKEAPQIDQLEKCEEDYKTLVQRVQSVDERARGARELIARHPSDYHWCFYSKILKLEEGLRADSYIDEKQKRIVSTYDYLVPIARAFMAEFKDSRYLRWAIRDYRRLSDAYFFRKLDMSPEMSGELVDIGDPFHEVPGLGTATPSRKDPVAESVLDKYKIGSEQSAGVTESASTSTSTAPLAETVPLARPEPVVPPTSVPPTDSVVKAAPPAEQTQSNSVDPGPAHVYDPPASSTVSAATSAPVTAPASAPVGTPVNAAVAPVTAPISAPAITPARAPASAPATSPAPAAVQKPSTIDVPVVE